MADPDIVVRLRQGWLAHWDTDVRFVMVYASEWVRLTNLTLEAADEIDRKNLTIKALTEERDECVRMANKLTAERDEARRMLCEDWAKQDGLPLDWQGRRGAEGMAEFVKWNCFKENTND